jgi:hypothetical protein
MLTKFYLMLGTTMMGFYGLSSYNGWEYGSAHREIVPAAERQPGWARSHSHSYHYWHSGYRGGK